ncbi:MAG: C40 family peptidase [Lachnospiraceae bacterium]|nr:C40 family peptidase [Lachnospiraceae bacterium]
MRRKLVKTASGLMVLAMTFSAFNITAQAAGVNKVLPSGGINLTISKGASLEELKSDDADVKIEETIDPLALTSINSKEVASSDKVITEEEGFKNLVIAQVDQYVNIRDKSSIEGNVVGKLYDDSVGEFLGEENGWYLIKSGTVEGYVKGEYCVTGDDAVDLAKQVGKRLAIVKDSIVKVHAEADADSEEVCLFPEGEQLLVLEEDDDWIKVDIEEGAGYISTDCVDLTTKFVRAESIEEERKRVLRQQAERQAARQAATAAMAAQGGTAATYTPPTVTYSGDGSIGSDVIAFALQFVGNPYVHGGNSLTTGTDCSGFTMLVYANFGVSLPRASSAYSTVGYEVEGGLANAQPGDIVVYSGHVALYMGDNQIVHASTPKGGIKVGPADYRQPITVRRIF